MLVSAVCVLLVSQFMVSDVMAQRPWYAPRPWSDYYGPQGNNATAPANPAPAAAAPTSGGIGGGNSGNSVASPPTGSQQPTNNQNGLPVRIFTPADDLTFRYFNNVPIQGPEAPCVGCLYRLTKNGFVKVQQ